MAVCLRCGERLDTGPTGVEQAIPVVTVATRGEQTGERSANLLCCPHCGAAAGVLADQPTLPQQP